MTVVERYPARSKYRCDICGAEGFWQDGWMHYSSLMHDEACPEEMPTVCGESCRRELDRRLKDGRVKLPKLRRTAVGAIVTSPRKGY